MPGGAGIPRRWGTDEELEEIHRGHWLSSWTLKWHKETSVNLHMSFPWLCSYQHQCLLLPLSAEGFFFFFYYIRAQVCSWWACHHIKNNLLLLCEIIGFGVNVLVSGISIQSWITCNWPLLNASLQPIRAIWMAHFVHWNNYGTTQPKTYRTGQVPNNISLSPHSPVSS